MQIELSGSGIAAIVGLLLSLALDYFPQFSRFWALQPGERKRMFLALVGLVVALGLMALHYAGMVNLGLGDFGWSALFQVFSAWIAFAGAGQLTYTTTHIHNE